MMQRESNEHYAYEEKVIGYVASLIGILWSKHYTSVAAGRNTAMHSASIS